MIGGKDVMNTRCNYPTWGKLRWIWENKKIELGYLRKKLKLGGSGTTSLIKIELEDLKVI